MAKITDPDSLVVSSNLFINTTNKTIGLTVAGSLVAKDGVTLQALYSKLVELWTTSTYNKFPFPMYTIDAKSGQFMFGTDGSTYNGWKPLDDTTRQMFRDAGWSEYSAAGALNRQYVGIVALTSGLPSGAQLYYQRAAAGTAYNFTFTDSPNEGIQVYGDAANGNFDNRTYFKIFCREYDYTYDDAILSDVGETGTGAWKISLPIAVTADLKIEDDDTTVDGSAPYTSMGITYYGSDQTGYDIGAYPFRVVVDNTTAQGTLEEVYTFIQRELRKATDIDDGAGTVTGKTADSLCYFVGDTLYTTTGVFINGVIGNDLNRVVFLDQNGVQRTYPYAAAGALAFNAFLASGGTGYYRMFFTNDDAGDNLGYDYGTANAITVNDDSDTAIAGTIPVGGVVNFTYDYDGNVQRGAASAGDDAPVTVVAGNQGIAKPVVATGTISRSKGISISLVAEQDRAYSNPA